MNQVLVPYDFSAFARRALALALQGFPFGKASVAKMLHIIDEGLYDNVLSRGHVPNEEAVSAYLAADLARVKADLPKGASPKAEAVQRIVRGHPAEKILENMRELNPAGIIMGGQGHGGLKERFLGRTAQRVLREATCPVLIIKDPESRSLPRHFLCAVDYSDASRKALKETAALAAANQAGFSLLHVIENPYVPYLERVAVEIHDEATVKGLRDEARTALLRFENDVLGKPMASSHHAVFGKVTETITDHARILHAGFVVVSSHGRGATGRAVLGSVAEDLVRRSPVDVLVIR